MLWFGKNCDYRDRRSSHHRPILELLKEARCNIESTAMGREERCTDCYCVMTGMPVWLRRSHAPSWGGIAMAAAPGRSIVESAVPGR